MAGRSIGSINGEGLAELADVLPWTLPSRPPSPKPGQEYYNSASGEKEYWDDFNGVWVEVGGGGTVPDADATTKGIVKLAGDLAGTADLPEVVSAQAGFEIDGDDPLDRANHIGTQLAATISNLAAIVKAYRLDEFADPSSDIPMAGNTFTGLRDGTGAQDPATVAQLAAAVAGIKFKSVRAATTANVTISTALNNGDTLDGITLATSDLVLVKNQSSPAENGVYVVGAVPARVDWMDTAAEVDGRAVVVEDGTVNAGHIFLTVSEVATLGTDPIAFTDISAIIVNLATGVTGTLPIANGGTGQTTAKAARETGLAAAGYKEFLTHTAGTTISISQATHGLRATAGLQVKTWTIATGDERSDIVNVSAGGDVTVTFGASKGADTIGVSITG